MAFALYYTPSTTFITFCILFHLIQMPAALVFFLQYATEFHSASSMTGFHSCQFTVHMASLQLFCKSHYSAMHLHFTCYIPAFNHCDTIVPCLPCSPHSYYISIFHYTVFFLNLNLIYHNMWYYYIPMYVVGLLYSILHGHACSTVPCASSPLGEGGLWTHAWMIIPANVSSPCSSRHLLLFSFYGLILGKYVSYMPSSHKSARDYPVSVLWRRKYSGLLTWEEEGGRRGGPCLRRTIHAHSIKVNSSSLCGKVHRETSI